MRDLLIKHPIDERVSDAYALPCRASCRFPDAYSFTPEDQPQALAAAIGAFCGPAQAR